MPNVKREKLSQQARRITENVGQTSQQKLQVCDGCGAYLSRLDNDRRLADHFVGKIHMGYLEIQKTSRRYKISIRKWERTYNIVCSKLGCAT